MMFNLKLYGVTKWRIIVEHYSHSHIVMKKVIS